MSTVLLIFMQEAGQSAAQIAMLQDLIDGKHDMLGKDLHHCFVLSHVLGDSGMAFCSPHTSKCVKAGEPLIQELLSRRCARMQ